MDNQFLDYKAWKTTNNELLMHLINNKSVIIARFKYVIAVVDYLFDQVSEEGKELDNNEEEMFEVGYQYIFNRFDTIKLIKEHVFNNNLFEMEQFAKSINLLFYVQDFVDDLESNDNTDKQLKKMQDLENRVMESIENKQQVPDELFAVVDDLSMQIYDELGLEYYSITDIFYDIAVELELISESDDDYLDIDDILNNQVS